MFPANDGVGLARLNLSSITTSAFTRWLLVVLRISNGANVEEIARRIGEERPKIFVRSLSKALRKSRRSIERRDCPNVGL